MTGVGETYISLVLGAGKGGCIISNQSDETTIPSWHNLEEAGAGDGIPTECERCGKPGTPRQQFQHMGVRVCYICADERADELRSEGEWA